MERCEVCGTENRGNAKFCRGCARALMPIEADTEAQKLASNRALRCGECQAIYSRGATVCAACGHPLDKAVPPVEPDLPRAPAAKWPGWVIGAVVLLAVVGVAGIWGTSGNQPEQGEGLHTADQASAADNAVRAAALPLAEPVEAAKPVAETLDEAQKAHYEELIRREAERAERARQTMDRLAAKEKALSEARAKKAAAERRRVEPTPDTPQSADGAVGTPPPAPSGGGAAPAAPAAPVQAPARVTVEQACAKETNFLARDLCRVDACRVAANANDPICVWYRRLEEERRNRLNN